MYTIHVNLFQLVTFYLMEWSETILFIAALVYLTFHGLHHVWTLCQDLVNRSAGAGRP